MIKVDHAAVYMECPKEEMLQLIAAANLTANEASQVLTGVDLSMLFRGVVDRYSLDEAFTLWTAAIEAYKDLVLMKGDTSNDDN